VRRLIDLSAVKRRSTDRLGTLVQAVAKRLIPLQQRPEPQEHESDTRYKARSGPPLPHLRLSVPGTWVTDYSGGRNEVSPMCQKAQMGYPRLRCSMPECAGLIPARSARHVTLKSIAPRSASIPTLLSYLTFVAFEGKSARTDTAPPSQTPTLLASGKRPAWARCYFVRTRPGRSRTEAPIDSPITQPPL
jgi:hypothetical protein